MSTTPETVSQDATTPKAITGRVGIWKLLNIPGFEICKNQLQSPIKEEVDAL